MPNWRSFSLWLLVCTPLLLAAAALPASSPWNTLWTVPCILFASVVITWGAESAQYFIAEGFALAILAWMQTLPEFAVEALLAWKRETPLLLAGLTGALRLLTGLAWPLIYVTASVVHRRRTGSPLRTIRLNQFHSVEVAALLAPVLYALFVWRKGTLHLYDGFVLIGIYGMYLVLLSRLPAQGKEDLDELERVPREIVAAKRLTRNVAIAACFALGGVMIYFTAGPFLGSIIGLAVAVGLPAFQTIQWLAPIVSEFPELLSTFYFARQEEKAATGLMNITSSNINQWTLLVATLPIAYSLSIGAPSAIALDAGQRSELLLTIAQSLTAVMFLANLSFSWLEAAAMFALFAAQFVSPALRVPVTAAYFIWTAIELGAMIARRRAPEAWTSFGQVWRAHLRR